MSNYITEAFKQFDLLESEDLSLDASGLNELRSFLDDAAVDPDDESIDIYDLEAEAKEDLQKSYEGKVVLECAVCHSHIFEDKENISVDEDETVCKDIECPYCTSNEGYFIVGEIAPYNKEEAEAFNDDELDEVDIEGAADDIDDEDIVEDLKESFDVSWDDDGFYDAYDNDPRMEEICNSLGITSDNFESLEDVPKNLKAQALKIYKSDTRYDDEDIIEESYRRRKPRRSLKEAWNGVFSPKFILDNSYEIPNKEEAKKLSDWLYQEEYDCGFSSKDKFLQAYHWTFDNLYKEFKEKTSNASISESKKSRRSKRNLKESTESPEKIKQALDRAAKNNSNILIQPYPGRGTINTISRWCKDNGYFCKVINAIVMDPEDLGGIISRNGKRLQSQLMSEISELDDRSVLVLDNLNRAPQEIQGALLSIIQKVPCMVVGILAGNSSLDPAFKSRFYKVDVNEAMKLDGVKELYDNDEIRGVEELEGVDELEGVKELHGEKHEAPIKESIEDVSVTTEDETMTMTTKEDGGIVVETSPKEKEVDFESEPISDEEMIVPVSDESSEEIDVASDALDDEDDLDFNEVKTEAEDEGGLEDLEEFDEDSFDNLGESYLRNCYENVKGFKTSGVAVKKNRLFIEGLITFDSGNKKKTNFVFEALKSNNGKYKFEGYNTQISKGKKTFKLSGTSKNKKFVCESLNYNYKSKNELNESVRVYGTVKRR